MQICTTVDKRLQLACPEPTDSTISYESLARSEMSTPHAIQRNRLDIILNTTHHVTITHISTDYNNSLPNESL